MNITKGNFIYLVLIVIIASIGCKESDDEAPDPEKQDVLCEGNGNLSFWPLDSARAWSYTLKREGVADTTISHFEINETKVLGGHEYFVVTNPEVTFWGVQNYLREDSVTHDIWNFKASNGRDYLEIPGAPELGVKWNYSFWSREVTNLDASLQTDNCLYTGLLEVTEWDGGFVKKMLYYKKGLGLVHQWYPPYNEGKPKVEFILADINFK